MADVTDSVAPDVLADRRPDVERIGDDDWVLQVARAGAVVSASPNIETIEPLGPVVDGETTRNVGPLSGGNSSNRSRLLGRSVETSEWSAW